MFQVKQESDCAVLLYDIYATNFSIPASESYDEE